MVSTRNQAYTSAAPTSISKQKPIKTKTCIICLEDLPTTSFPRRTPTKLCSHRITICTTCLDTWITTTINTQYRTQLRCPYPDCTEEICPRQDLKAGSPHQLRIRQVSDRIFQDKTPDWRWCLNPACDSGQKHVAPIPVGPGWPVPLNLFTCRKCQVLSCATCDVLWHAGMTCEEYARGSMRRLVEVKVDEKIIERLEEDGRIKECPNCNCPIEMDQPGGKMKCSRCLYSFEWDAI